MHAVREVDLGLAPAVGLLDFVDGGRAEILAWIAVFLCASPYTDVEIEHFQMRRLIFVMLRARAVNVGHFSERQLVVVFRRLGLGHGGWILRPAVKSGLP